MEPSETRQPTCTTCHAPMPDSGQDFISGRPALPEDWMSDMAGVLFACPDHHDQLRRTIRLMHRALPGRRS